MGWLGLPDWDGWEIRLGWLGNMVGKFSIFFLIISFLFVIFALKIDYNKMKRQFFSILSAATVLLAAVGITACQGNQFKIEGNITWLKCLTIDAEQLSVDNDLTVFGLKSLRNACITIRIGSDEG